MEENKKPRLSYNIDLLNECFKKSNATENEIYKKLTQESIINYICNCGETGNKKFLYIVRNNGAYCNTCSKKNRRRKTIETSINKYGCPSPTQNKDIKKKIKNTCITKYGVENPCQSTKVRDKMKETMLKKYGKEHPLQTLEAKEKFKETLEQRYGVTVPYHNIELKNKGKETCKKIYGVENPFQNEEVKQKIINTNMIKYGVEYPSQNTDIMLKTQANAKKYKKYQMPSGEIRNVQGYEPFAITELLKEYNEQQIKTDRADVPRIKYVIDNKDKYYFPDIYIPTANRLIEVKSLWTYKCKKDNLSYKKDATTKLGYLFEVWIFDTNGNRILSEDT